MRTEREVSCGAKLYMDSYFLLGHFEFNTYSYMSKSSV